MPNPYQIHFQGAPYSNELYDEQGREVRDLDTAIETAVCQYPDESFELFNGNEAHQHNWH